MTQYNQGLPPGIQLGRPPGPEQLAAAQKRRQDAQLNAVNELASKLPGGLKGTPVLFNDGIPQMDDEPIAELTPAERAAMSGKAVPAHEIATQAAQYSTPRPQPQVYTPDTGRIVSQKAREAHPVLQRLRKSFKLSKERRYPLEIYSGDDKFTYLMVPNSDSIGVFVLNEAQKKLRIDGEAAGTSWFRMLSACASVIAIDDIPIHEIYGLVPTPEEERKLAEDKFDIPDRLRKLTALTMANELWEDTDTGVGDKLDTFYQDKILSDNKVMSSYDKEFDGAHRYVCPVDGCQEVHLSKPQLTAEGAETPFYCRYHGKELIKTVSLATEASVPLA